MESRLIAGALEKSRGLILNPKDLRTKLSQTCSELLGSVGLSRWPSPCSDQFNKSGLPFRSRTKSAYLLAEIAKQKSCCCFPDESKLTSSIFRTEPGTTILSYGLRLANFCAISSTSFHERALTASCPLPSRSRKLRRFAELSLSTSRPRRKRFRSIRRRLRPSRGAVRRNQRSRRSRARSGENRHYLARNWASLRR